MAAASSHLPRMLTAMPPGIGPDHSPVQEANRGRAHEVTPADPLAQRLDLYLVCVADCPSLADEPTDRLQVAIRWAVGPWTAAAAPLTVGRACRPLRGAAPGRVLEGDRGKRVFS